MSAPLGRCLVLGGSGFVGRSLCRLLYQTDGVVRVTNFDRSPPSISSDSKVQFVSGDVRNKESLREVVEQADTIFFLLTNFRLTRTHADYRDSEAVCIDGLRNVVQLCKSSPALRLYPRRIVFTSSYTIFWSGVDIRHGNEETPRRPLEDANPYSYCKLLSEEMLAKSYDVDKLLTRTVILSGVYGPASLGLKTLSNWMWCGSVVNMTSMSQTSVAFVDNVSNGLILVAKQLTPSLAGPPDPVLLADFNCSISDLYSEIFNEAGVQVRILPFCCLYLFAVLSELWHCCCVNVLRSSSWNIVATREGLSIPAVWFTFDASRAEREFGYGPSANWWVSKDEAFARTAASVKALF